MHVLYGVELKENVDGGMPQPLSDEKMNEVFDGEDVKDDDDYPNLQYMSISARQIAEETYCSVDCSIHQLERNLKSLIWQKSTEMHMLGKLCSMTSDELRNYYSNRFDQYEGKVMITRRHLTEAAELVRRARKIFIAFQEAREFEENFIQMRSKIPRSFFFCVRQS